MKIITSIIGLIILVCCVLYVQDVSAHVTDDVNVLELNKVYAPMVYKPSGNPAIVQLDAITIETIAIDELPDNPITESIEVEDCPGGWGIYGPHPCPNNDTATPLPQPPHTNGNH